MSDAAATVAASRIQAAVGRPAAAAHADQAVRWSGETPLTLRMSSRRMDPFRGPWPTDRCERADGLTDAEDPKAPCPAVARLDDGDAEREAFVDPKDQRLRDRAREVAEAVPVPPPELDGFAVVVVLRCPDGM